MIDKTLTVEKAVAQIGDILPHTVYDEFPNRSDLLPLCRDQGVQFSWDKQTYDMTWIFSKDSQYVRSVHGLRQAQKEHGFTHEETLNAHKHLSFAERSLGIGSICLNYGEQATPDYGTVFCENSSLNSCQAIYETLLNTVEHGSDYCTKGEVSVRFRGGVNGALVEVNDPGQGEIILPLTVEEIVKRKENAGIKHIQLPQTYRDLITSKRKDVVDRQEFGVPLARGMGSIVLTLSKATINVKQDEHGYHVFLLYNSNNLPEWWQGVRI